MTKFYNFLIIIGVFLVPVIFLTILLNDDNMNPKWLKFEIEKKIEEANKIEHKPFVRKLIRTENIGKVVNVEYIEPTFCVPSSTNVKTEKKFFWLRGNPEIPLDKDIFIEYYNDDTKRYCYGDN